jgi:hypothetical protein
MRTNDSSLGTTSGRRAGRIKIQFWIPVFLFWILFLWLSVVFWNVLIILLLLTIAILLVLGEAVLTIKFGLGLDELRSSLRGTIVYMDNPKTLVNIRMMQGELYER